MKRIALATLALALAACGGSSDSGPSAPTLSSASAIATYLDGKTLTMAGDNIPAYPNGYNQNMYLGASTQCYHQTTIQIAGTTWAVTSQLGTLTGASTLGAIGTCDRTTVAGNPVSFTSNTVLVENVQGNGTCFDITVTYTGFSQEGRGAFSEDGKTLKLELFFGGQAANHRCANGVPGTSGVLLKGAAFTGNAVQTYAVTTTSGT